MQVDRHSALPLIVGLPGTVLEAPDLDVLRQVRPVGIILFARNIDSAETVRSLVARLQELDPPPFVCIDLEGGRVNRLSRLWGELPSPAKAAAHGRRAVRALGDAAGAACRSLGIHLDLAPVVDLETENGRLGAEDRCFDPDPERVAQLANTFTDGLAGWCVSGCLKHFPGLGPVSVDTHEALPEILSGEAEIEHDLRPFRELSSRVRMVMVSHAVVPSLGDPERPSSLAPAIIERAASLPGKPVVVTDDLEMGALSGWGDLGDLTMAALDARCHGVILSSRFEELSSIAERLTRKAEQDSRFAKRLENAAVRLGTLRQGLCRDVAAMPTPSDETVAQLWEAARARVGSIEP